MIIKNILKGEIALKNKLRYFYVCTNRRKYSEKDILKASKEGPFYNTYKEAENVLERINDDCDYDIFTIDENNIIKIS